MKSRYTQYIFISMLAAAMNLSCTDGYRDMNTNPNEATEDMLDYDNLRVGAFITTMQMDVIPASDANGGDYQISQNLTGDIFSGYMGAINEGFNGNNVYNLHFNRWNDRAFDVAFTKVMPAWKRIVSQVADKDPIAYSLAQVLKVSAIHRLADNYGPLPYLDFGHGGIQTKYDSLEDIYMSFFADLDAAIMVFEDFVAKTPSARPLKDFDLVYGGDFGKWLKYANTLKMRLAMRISYVKPDMAREKAEEAVRSGLILENSDNATLKSMNGISVFNPLKICWDEYSDTRMGANMESFLTGYNDNRLSKYFMESTFEEGGYHGVRNGVRIMSKSSYLPCSVPNIIATDPIIWMTASESYFLMAEGALRGWDMKGEAKDFYEQGIKTSFEQWKATFPDSYLTDSESLPAEFIDMVGFSSIKKGKYLSTATIAWDESSDFETKLEKIITQKWIALYPNGQEAWTEFRRTNYPRIFPVEVNNSNNTIDTETQIRRITFPESEYDNNKPEVEKAISLLGGPDTGGTKLWWDKK